MVVGVVGEYVFPFALEKTSDIDGKDCLCVCSASLGDLRGSPADIMLGIAGGGGRA